MRRLTIALLLAASFGCSEREAIPQSSTLTAQQILGRTATVYARAQTYRDAGSVLIDDPLLWKAFQFIVRGDSRHRFSTTFERQRGGSFHFQSQNGGRWTASVAPDTLRTLVGVSHGASIVVPPLLAAEQGSPTVANLTNATREKDEQLGRTPCFVVRGVDARGRQYRLWIEQDRFVIRKAESRAVTNGLELHDTIEFEDVALH